MLYFISNSFKSVMVNKTRTLLIMLCFAVCVFSLLIISAVSKTGSEVISNQLDGLGLYGLSVRFDEQSTYYFTNSDVEMLMDLDEIKSVMPITAKYCTVDVRGSKDNCVIWGVDNNAVSILDMDIISGSGISREDVTNCSRKCLISEGYAQEKFGSSNIVGRTISINIDGKNYDFTINGITSAGTADLRKSISSFIPYFIYVNNAALIDITGQNNIERLAIEPSDDFDSYSAGAKAKQLLNIKYNGQFSFIIEDVNEQLSKVDTVMNTVSLVLSVIGSIAMIITGISIMSVMILSVNERKREISIKKSIGAGKIRIMSEFISEAIIIAIGGCAAGTVAAILLIMILKIIGIDMSLSVSGLIATEIFSIAVGIVFGAYPALKAARMKPIEGLKSE